MLELAKAQDAKGEIEWICKDAAMLEHLGEIGISLCLEREESDERFVFIIIFIFFLHFL